MSGSEEQTALEYIKSRNEAIKRGGGEAPKCYVHSFGCQQNVSDGEKLLGALISAGFEPCGDIEQAGLIIFNTCAVRENAEDKVYAALGGLKKLKRKDPGLIIGICGCMAQQKKTEERIKSSFPHVDLVFGTFAYGDLYSMLERIMRDRERVFNIEEKYCGFDEGAPRARSSSFMAYVPIMYGCNNFCTYCIVPYVRGRERSRLPEDIEKEVRELAESGYKEIMLLGQNVNSYSYGFPELLRRLDNIEGDLRIRFMSSHPKDASNELIDTILDSKKICRHLHLALQSGCDRILKEMNRRYTADDYMKIVEYARSRDSGFSFSTDLIVGFPGESYEEFCQTKEFIKKVKFDNIYSFVYSPRSGTKAAKLPDEISRKEKGLWLRELLLEQRETSTEWLSRFIGKVCRVLAEEPGKEPGTLCGKNDENIIVVFKGGEELIGSFVNVRIDKAMNWAVSGEIVN